MQLWTKVWKNTWRLTPSFQNHKYYRPIALIAILPFLSLHTTADTENSSQIPLHHFDLPCQSCHSSSVINSFRMNNRDQNSMRITSNINQSCAFSGCHEYDTWLNHPLNVTVANEIPSTMRLSANSTINCLTCHMTLASSEKSESEYPQEPQEPVLRVPDGSQFCDSCHLRMAGSSKLRSHWQFSQKAHLGNINPQSVTSKNSDSFIDSIDTESHACLGCHEDITVTIPRINETKRQKMQPWQNMADHPIAMEYEYIAMKNTRDYFYPILDTDRIRFFNGKLGCGSCHSVYAKTENHLIKSNDHGQLCKTCHNK